jgi:hypothetical protein
VEQLSIIRQPDITKQHELFEYHDETRTGFFSLLLKQESQTPQQKSYPLSDMATVIKLLPKDKNSYISQGEFFRPNRRVVNLARIGLCFVDIDTYHSGLMRGKQLDAQVQTLLWHISDLGIPEPSLVMFSGRGLYAKWILETPVPKQALPRWNALQRQLVTALEPLGADQGAKDASRVLRIEGTVNSKSGEVARVVWSSEEKYNFDLFCECVLPVSREVIEKNRQKKQLKAVERSKTPCKQRKTKSIQMLNWTRLNDLRAICELRGGVSEGERMLMMFWQLNFLLLSGATNPNQMFYEALSLGRQLDPHWTFNQSDLSTLYIKARAHFAGERISLDGKRYSPLYTPKNQYLIDLFNITGDEQKLLKTIIDSNEGAERDRNRKRLARAKAGAKAHASEETRAEARKMADSGMSQRAIAKMLGVGVGTINSWLKSKRSVSSL